MKKFLLLLIAIFVTGEMCKAQTLPTKPLLADSSATASVSPQKAVMHASTSSEMYWMSAQSYYNEYRQFDTSGTTYPKEFKVNLTVDGTDVTIDGLFDMSKFTYNSPVIYEIAGTYDPEAKTISIPTPSYNSDKDLEDYTKVGTMSYYGTNLTLCLFTGDLNDTPDKYGSYYFNLVDTLVFDVSDDLTTLTARSGFGCCGFYDYDGSNAGFVDFYKGATLEKLTEEANLSVTPAAIDFSGASVTVGSTHKVSVSLTNKSTKDTDFTVKVVGNGLSIATTRDIAAASTMTYELTFKPKKEGDFEGSITFIATNGATATVDITATVGAAPDYSGIVNEGDIVFSLSDDQPFVLTDTIVDGKTVAVSTNSGTSSSTLIANFNVPEGKKGVISWSGVSVSQQPNGVKITLDDTQVFNNLYSHNGELGHDDIANTCIVESGDHVLSFVNTIMMDWYEQEIIKEPLRTWVYDMSLQLVDAADDAAILKDAAMDFGRHYIDLFEVTDTATVRLLNAGDNALKLNSVDASDHFTALITDSAATFGHDLPVEILFTADEIGSYDENIVLHTTAGDFTVRCQSSTEQIIYDYSPIVAEGTFSFNTSLDYPFIVDDNTARSNISGLSPLGVDLTAWLKVEFDVPEGKTGVVSWEGLNSSLDFFYFMDAIILENGTYIVIDDSIRQEFAGSEVDCGSYMFDETQTTFAPGRHSILFAYQKINEDIVGTDCLTLSNLALTLNDGTSIAATSMESPAVSTQIYSIDGKPRTTLQRGVNIIRTTHADGSITTKKQIVK